LVLSSGYLDSYNFSSKTCKLNYFLCWHSSLRVISCWMWSNKTIHRLLCNVHGNISYHHMILSNNASVFVVVWSTISFWFCKNYMICLIKSYSICTIDWRKEVSWILMMLSELLLVVVFKPEVKDQEWISFIW
jgi:hypothetical protein